MLSGFAACHSVPTDLPAPARRASHAGAVGVLDANIARRRRVITALRLHGFHAFRVTLAEIAAKVVDARPLDVLIVGELEATNFSDARAAIRNAPGGQVLPILRLRARTPSGDVAPADAVADDLVFGPLRTAALAAQLPPLIALHDARAELERSSAQRGVQTQTMLSLLDLSAALNASETIEELLRHVVTAAAQLTQSRDVALLLPEAPDGRLLVVDTIGQAFERFRSTQRRPAGPALAEALACDQVFRLPERDHPQLLAEFPLPIEAECVCVPLRAQRRNVAESHVGLLCLAGRVGGSSYTDREIESLDLLRTLCGTATQGLAARYWRDEARDSLVLALVALTERRDNDTARHLDRVTTFSLLLADDLRRRPGCGEIDDAWMQDLRRSAPLHDVGKVGIPDRILLKPDRLTPEEFDTMKTHTVIGAQTIHYVRVRMPNSTFAKMAEDIARHHHERYDGTGYPDGLRGDAIPLAARIVSLADVYDALTTQRVYKPALSHETALDLISAERGAQFDPRVVDAFLRRQQRFQDFAAALADDAEGDADEAAAAAAGAYPLHWFLSAPHAHAAPDALPAHAGAS
ncbi:MAG: HD domain-containing phosphohydrolase [Phycisphaerae bacterium]